MSELTRFTRLIFVNGESFAANFVFLKRYFVPKTLPQIVLKLFIFSITIFQLWKRVRYSRTFFRYWSRLLFCIEHLPFILRGNFPYLPPISIPTTLISPITHNYPPPPSPPATLLPIALTTPIFWWQALHIMQVINCRFGLKRWITHVLENWLFVCGALREAIVSSLFKITLMRQRWLRFATEKFCKGKT